MVEKYRRYKDKEKRKKYNREYQRKYALKYRQKRKLEGRPLNTRTGHRRHTMRLFICIECGVVSPYRHGKASINKFCSTVCQGRHKTKTNFERWLLNLFSPANSRALKRLIALRDGYKCARCGISEWQGKPLVLEVDHVNGNSTDHRPANVHLICPNCHSQTPNYKGANPKGNGRYYFRMRYRQSKGLPIEDKL